MSSRRNSQDDHWQELRLALKVRLYIHKNTVRENQSRGTRVQGLKPKTLSHTEHTNRPN